MPFLVQLPASSKKGESEPLRSFRRVGGAHANMACRQQCWIGSQKELRNGMRASSDRRLTRRPLWIWLHLEGCFLSESARGGPDARASPSSPALPLSRWWAGGTGRLYACAILCSRTIWAHYAFWSSLWEQPSYLTQGACLCAGQWQCMCKRICGWCAWCATWSNYW